MFLIHLYAKETHSEEGDEEEIQENGVEVLGEISNFEQCELEYDVAFTLHKEISCFSHTLQLVVHKL